MLEGATVCVAFGVYGHGKHVKYIVAESQVEEEDAQGGESEYQRSNARIGDCDDGEEGKFGVSVAPVERAESNIAFKLLAWGRVQEGSYDVEDEERCNLEDCRSGYGDTLEDEEGEIEG
jgi:hypothetical protein